MASKYASYTEEQVREHLSKYLIDSWSYSKVNGFARDELEFAKNYVYCEPSKRSASSIAGNAYHEALRCYFEALMEGKPELSIIDAQSVAFLYIEEVPANDWKLQKTTPTIEKAKSTAVTSANALIENFYKEKDVYLSDLAEVLAVEKRYEAWVTINGADIPLPCHGILDLMIKTKDGRTVIIDHKSKSAYTDEKEIVLVRGKQAIAYVKMVETVDDVHVDEVWFIENKISKNRDNTPQMRKFLLPLDEDSRALYESMLYSPLRRMVNAVADPDYDFVANDANMMSDKAEMYEFWCRTQIAEVSDFNYIPEAKRDMMAKRQRKIKDSSVKMVSPKAITEFRKHAASFIQFDYSMTNLTNPEKIEHVLRTLGFLANVAHEIKGYSSDTYLLEASAGMKLSALSNFRLDIANALDVPNVRIAKNLVVYEGKSYLSIEANKKREEDLVWESSLRDGYKIPLGKDNYKRTVYWDLENHSAPHMLVCGGTGSGKSVCLRSTIKYALEAGMEVIIFDPKYEFINTEGAMVYNEIEDIESMMAQLVDLMRWRVRDGVVKQTLVVFDEFADALDSSRKGKALQGEKSLLENLKMLLQKSRSTGMHFVVATQRASTKIITGDIKVNLPVQVCFRVPKSVDSRVVLDEEGAEGLAGLGDALLHSPEYLDIVRFQGLYSK